VYLLKVPSKLVHQLENLLLDRINELSPEQSLPPERTLAKEFHVTRRTLRKAYASLEAKDIIRRINGKGTFPVRGRRAIPIFQRRARMIGIVIGRAFRTFFQEIARAALHAAHAQGYNLVLALKDEEQSFYRILDDPHVDGLCLYEVNDQKLIRELSERKKPTCLINHYSYTANVDSVQNDSHKASATAVRYLYTLGHRKIAFVDSNDPEYNPERRPGYEKGMQKLKILRRPEWVMEKPSTGRAGREVVSYILSLSHLKKPTAVIVFSTTVAIGMYKELVNHRLRIGKDISVLSLGARLNRERYPSVPDLTQVASDNASLGRRAIELLIERIKKPNLPRRNILIPVFVEEGKSSGKI
jgi:LacI family transcriptional regulator